MRRIALCFSITLITFIVGISVADAWNLMVNSSTGELPNPHLDGEPTMEIAPSSRAAERALLELYQQYAVAQTNHDVSFFERVEPENFVLFEQGGRRLSRSEDLEFLRSLDRSIKYTIDELRIQHYYDGAIVTGRMTAEYPTNNRHFWRWIDVCVWRNGRWKILSTTQL